MKRFIVLLVLLAGGVAVAAFAIPSNAIDVNGSSVSQSQLKSDVRAVANSAEYQCFLNSQAYVGSQGTAEAPPVTGAGTAQNAGDDPTATNDFVSSYLAQQVSAQLVYQEAARRGVTVSSAQTQTARTTYEREITSTMAEVAQTAEGQNPAFSCGHTTSPLTGSEVLATLPSSFVDGQVHFLATATELAEDLSGYGSSDAGLLRYFQSHLTTFDTTCFTVGVYASEADAAADRAKVTAGTDFSTLASATQGGGPQGCEVLYEVSSQLPADANLQKLPLNTVSDPIQVGQSQYVLVEVTKRTPTAFSAVKSLVTNAVEQAGEAKYQAAIEVAARHAHIDVNPQYGTWVDIPGKILVPLAPQESDVPNAAANAPSTTSSSASASPFSG